MKLNMDILETVFHLADDYYANYVAIMVSIDGVDGELIINPIKNAESKLKYYKETYDYNLVHRHNQNIKITGIYYGDTLSDIEKVFLKQTLTKWNYLPIKSLTKRDESE